MTDTIPFWQFGLANIFIFFGAFVQGAIGLGVAIVSVPLLLLLNENFVPVPVMLVSILLMSVLVVHNRHEIRIRNAAQAITGYLIGAVAAGFVISFTPQRPLSILFAAAIIIAVLLSFTGRSFSLTPFNTITVSGVAGLMGTITAIAGPPLGLLYQKEKGPTARGTLAAIFFAGAIITNGINFITGRVNLQHLMIALALLPGLLAGIILSRYFARLLDGGYFRPAILLMCLFSACISLVKNLI